MHLSLFLPVLLACSITQAAVVVSATVTVPQITTIDCCHDEQSFALDYTLLVAAPAQTGAATAVLNVMLGAVTNETDHTRWQFGASSYVSAQIGTTTVGGCSAPGFTSCAWYVNVSYPAGTVYLIDLPFVFNVPETVHLTEGATAFFGGIYSNMNTGSFAGYEIRGYVDVLGIGSMNRGETWEGISDASVTFDPLVSVPEPSGLGALLLPFLILLRRAQHDVPF